MSKKNLKEYAMYCGEDCVAIGTLDEIATARGIKRESVRFMLTPTYRRRMASHRNSGHRLEVFLIEEGEDE